MLLPDLIETEAEAVKHFVCPFPLDSAEGLLRFNLQEVHHCVGMNYAQQGQQPI